jgi:hypothetical protein
MTLLGKAFAGAATAAGVGLLLLTPASATPTHDRQATLEFGVNFRPFQDNYVDIMAGVLTSSRMADKWSIWLTTSDRVVRRPC